MFLPVAFFCHASSLPQAGSPLLGLGLPFSLSSCQGAGFMGLVVPSFFPMAGGGGGQLPPCSLLLDGYSNTASMHVRELVLSY